MFLYSSIVVQVDKFLYSFVSVEITAMKKLKRELQKHKENLEALVKERTKELEQALQVITYFAFNTKG